MSDDIRMPQMPAGNLQAVQWVKKRVIIIPLAAHVWYVKRTRLSQTLKTFQEVTG